MKAPAVLPVLALCAWISGCTLYTPPGYMDARAPSLSGSCAGASTGAGASAGAGEGVSTASRESAAAADGTAVTGGGAGNAAGGADGAVSGDAGTGDAGSLALQQIALLEAKNRELELSHQKIFSYFMWLTSTILAGAVILVVLNVRESRRKDRIIYNSEQLLQHSIQVQEAERRRISLELHDSVAQGLRYVSLLAENLADKEAAQKIIATQNENIGNIRRLCYNLTPPAITGSSLVPSLILLGQKIFDTGSSGFQFRVVCEPSVDFAGWSGDSLMNLYRIVQESLQNIQKHACAEEATVFFKTCGANSLKVIITDDGCGMDAALVARVNSASFDDVKNLHFGLRNIFERAKLLGGKVTYVSEKDCGTRLTLEL